MSFDPRGWIRFFLELERLNSELFASAKMTMLGGIVAISGVLIGSSIGGVFANETIIAVAAVVVGIFSLLVLYRFWEALRFEVEWPELPQ